MATETWWDTAARLSASASSRFGTRPLLRAQAMGPQLWAWDPWRSRHPALTKASTKVYLVTWWDLAHKEENRKEAHSNPHGWWEEKAWLRVPETEETSVCGSLRQWNVCLGDKCLLSSLGALTDRGVLWIHNGLHKDMGILVLLDTQGECGHSFDQESLLNGNISYKHIGNRLKSMNKEFYIKLQWVRLYWESSQFSY